MRNNITDELEEGMLLDNALHDRAYNKVFAKIAMLNIEVDQLREDLKTQNTGCISMEDLTMVYIGTRKELKTWMYIALKLEQNG